MPSKIQVDQIAGATGSTVTLPSGQTLDLSSGTVNLPSASLSALNASNLTSGTVPSARLSLTSSDLPTVPTTKGGTGLTTIGTAGQVIKVNSGATALEYGTAPSGKVLQVITATDSTERSTTSSSFVTGSNTLSVTITPSSASSKIFVITSFGYATPSGTYAGYTTIYRGATNLGNSTYGMGRNEDGTNLNYHIVSMHYLDSPSSTSALTYQVYFAVQTGGPAAYINRNNAVGSITAFEIGA